MSEIVRMHDKKPEANRKNSISMKQRTNLSQSTYSPVDRIMFFQRTIGNQAVQGLIRSGNLRAKPKKGREAGKEAGAARQIQGKQEATIRQCKERDEVQRKEKEDEEEEKVCKVGMIQKNLVVGSPGDIYEQEAERVSTEVSNSRIFSMGNVQQEYIYRVDVPEFLGLVESRGREISPKDKDGARRVRISTDCGGSCPHDRTVSPSLESRILQSKGSGSALPPFIRKSMELQTGYDFNNVRVKTDSEAAGLNKSLGARAFTNGSDIWLGRNESVTDVKLMAHELTHVVQQGAAPRIQYRSANENDERYVQSSELHIGMANQVLQRWPGDGMLPPGDCSWARYLVLRGSVETAKAVVSMLGACSAGDSCLFLATKIAAITAEITARVAVAATCFRGGDTGHREQVEGKANMMKRCFRFFTGSNCSPELIGAMAVVVERAREVIAAATAAVAIALVIALIAAIIALAEVIAALVAAAAEAAAAVAAVAAVIALLILIKDELPPAASSSA